MKELKEKIEYLGKGESTYFFHKYDKLSMMQILFHLCTHQRL